MSPIRFRTALQPTIADVHSAPFPEYGYPVLEVGVGFSNLAVLTVETECGVKAYAGPVFSYHEFILPDLQRLTDGEWKTKLIGGEDDSPAWTYEFAR
jgi:hypothetical protein